MNNLEQILRRQIRRKDEQIKGLLLALGESELTVEALQSIGCAFAWDLQSTGSRHLTHANWDNAVAKLGEE